MPAQSVVDLESDGMECTSITVGKKASADGSVMTSHTDDSHRSRTNIYVTPAQDYERGEMQPLYKREWAKKQQPGQMQRYDNILIGEIPQVDHTYQFLNTAYPCVNEAQLAIGESTFGGRSELKSDSGLIDCQRLCMLLLQRCCTAREAIETAGVLLKKYGWIDAGECLTIADKDEVWHLEILGPYYYLLIVKAMYITKTDTPLPTFVSDRNTKTALGVCTAGIALFGIVSCIYNWIAAAGL